MSNRALTFLRRLLRFRLRTLLLAVLVISVALGIYVKRAKQQQQSVAAIKRLGGWAYYDYQLKDDNVDLQGESWVPAWLRSKLGDDYFHTVVHVNMVYNDDSGKQIQNPNMSDEILSHLDGLPRLEMLLLHGKQASDAGLAKVGRLANLRMLYIWNGTNVTDAGVAHLAGCRRLEYLHLSESKLGDDGMRVLSELPRLRKLSLQGNFLTDAGLAHAGKMRQIESLWIGETGFRNRLITDAGVAHLAKLPKLEELDLQSTAVTDAGLVHLERMQSLKYLYLDGSKVSDTSRLQAALPGCKVDQ
ncbi:MAG TPA: hypothetical protein VFB96_23280 [Pirellulaceae bacterium]|nr:hypothetical protein [Pirellulaceae bacterium]